MSQGVFNSVGELKVYESSKLCHKTNKYYRHIQWRNHWSLTHQNITYSLGCNRKYTVYRTFVYKNFINTLMGVFVNKKGIYCKVKYVAIELKNMSHYNSKERYEHLESESGVFQFLHFITT